MTNPIHVDGEQPVGIFIYALSTCGWCRKTKNLLSGLGIAYDYIDVDLLEGDEREQVTQEVIKWNPACSFPTIVIDNREAIVGFQEEKLKKLVGK